MPKCRDCNDTGTIKTGNNDIPCQCSAGDMALFNVAGEGIVRGIEIKRRNGLPQMPTKLGDRMEFGHEFRWYERPGCWYATSGQPVMVVPPQTFYHPWLVIIPDSNSVDEIAGHDAEMRSFAVALAYTHQLKSAA